MKNNIQQRHEHFSTALSLISWSDTYQEQILINIHLFKQLFHTFLMSYIEHQNVKMCLDNDKQLFHPSLGLHVDQEQIQITWILLKQLFGTYKRVLQEFAHDFVLISNMIKPPYIQFNKFVIHSVGLLLKDIS